ncbi:MAG: ABC transporter substrate-binding protein [Bacteroidota bacterium]
MYRLLWFYVSVFAMLLAGCSPDNTHRSNDQVVTIATLKGPSAISMVKMMQTLDTVAGRPVEFRLVDEPLQVRKMMMQKEVDLAVLPSTMGALLYNKGVNYQLAAIPVWGTLYLFGTDNTIGTWEDLRGKRIHLMARGMTPDIVFRHLLEAHGLDTKTAVSLDYSFPTHIDLANAVMANRASLAVLSEPLVSMVKARNKRVQPLFDLNAEWNQVHRDTLPMAQTALLVEAQFGKENKQWMKHFLAVYEENLNWVNDNPQLAAPFIVEQKILPDEQVAVEAIPGCNMAFKATGAIKKELGAYFQLFYQENPAIIGGMMPDEEFYYIPTHP